MSVINSPTFCVAPWTGLNIDHAGRVTPCMHCFDNSIGNIKKNTISEIINGSKWKEIKQSMQHGEWHPACNNCRTLEETSGSSGRTVKTASQDTLRAIEQFDLFQLQHLTINWSNLCNLTCVYCNPGTSTAWQSAKKIPINHQVNEHASLIELVKQQGQSIQGISLGGGEPLLQKGLVELLTYLDPDNVQVMITTNLSVDITKNPIYQLLREWKHVHWLISFDNERPDRFEYVRDQASWQVFYNNIKIMKQHHQTIVAHPAYSIYCAFDLESYYEFCIENELPIYWCELSHPMDLDVRRLPEHLRLQAVEEIDNIVEKFGSLTDLSIDTLKGYQSTLLDPSYLTNIKIDPLVFHRRIEKELQKKNSFVELWPHIAQQLTM